MSIQEIVNYLQITDRIASSGQPEKHQFKSIANTGYQLVINLAMPDSNNAIPEEGQFVTALNMTYVHIPVPFDAPNIDHLRKFINVMTAFSDQKKWVHCAANYRASAFLFQYERVVLGLSVDQAKRVLLPSWQPDEAWQRFMAVTPTEINL